MPAPLRFRAYQTVQKKMYSPEEMGGDELTLAVDGRGLVNVSGVSPKLSRYLGETMIVMQSTGVHDLNGKEIFEGDKVIFGWEVTFSSGHWPGYIAWDAASACWMIETEAGISVRLTDVLDENAAEHDIEVIGNFHQNADLLTTA